MSWRARYTDPDTRAEKWETLPAELTTEEQRSGWAVAKAEEIADRERVLEKGATRKTGTAVTEAVEVFFMSAIRRAASAAPRLNSGDGESEQTMHTSPS